LKNKLLDDRKKRKTNVETMHFLGHKQVEVRAESKISLLDSWSL